MICRERERLQEICCEAINSYGEAIALAPKVKTDAQRELVRRASQLCDISRKALSDHIAHHDCGPPSAAASWSSLPSRPI